MAQIRYMTGPEVRKRYGVTAQTLITWTRAESPGSPKPLPTRPAIFGRPAHPAPFPQRQRDLLASRSV